MIITALAVISIFLAFSYIFIAGGFIFGWLRIKGKDYHPSGALRVSILIAARNEEKCIAACVGDLLRQAYPASLMEIIVIDDHSSDTTADIVAAFTDERVQLVRLNESGALNSYKKKAISEGIKKATGRLILTTDADCRVGPDWVSQVVGFYEANRYKLISAPVAYMEEKSPLEKLQSLEFSYLIAVGASSVANGVPFTCNGANLCYEKQIFQELNGFEGIDDLASGDDELLLHKVAEAFPGQIGFLKSLSATVYTHAQPTFADFLKQRKRWASKSVKYRNKRMVVMVSLVFLFNASILLDLFAGVFSQTLLHVGLGALAIKFVLDSTLLVFTSLFFNKTHLLVWLVPVSFFHVFYMVFIGLLGNAGKYEWKGRMVK